MIFEEFSSGHTSAYKTTMSYSSSSENVTLIFFFKFLKCYLKKLFNLICDLIAIRQVSRKQLWTVRVRQLLERRSSLSHYVNKTRDIMHFNDTNQTIFCNHQLFIIPTTEITYQKLVTYRRQNEGDTTSHVRQVTIFVFSEPMYKDFVGLLRQESGKTALQSL